MSRPTLKSVSTVITKGTTPTTVGGKFTESGIIFIKSESIAGSKHPAREFYTYIDEATDRKLKRSRLREGDLLVSIAGAYLGKLSIVTKRDVPSNTNQAVGIVRLDPQKASVDYIYYYFSQLHLNAHINKLSSQSSQPNLNLELLGNLEFDPKSFAEQKRIAGVLTALDAKIELNNRINAELEGMAKLLYDYWFVQFDFPMTAAQATTLGNPDLTGHPYRASGGKMIYNATLKRDIPEGWKISSVKELAPVLTGKEDANHATMSGEFHFFTCGEQSLRCDDFKFEGKAVLVVGNGNFSVKFFDGPFNAYQRTYVLLPRDETHFALIYFAIFDAIKGLTKGSQGSIIKFLTKGNIGDVALFLPSQSDKEVFWNSINTILSNILVNRKQNEELAQLRDWLLPMLMNGQVTVN